MYNKINEKVINNFKIAPHFKLKEFECPCCNRVMVHPVLVDTLEQIRREWNKPITVTSGYRCAFHNIHVGGEETSKHRIGEAADITPFMADEIYDLAAVCRKHGDVLKVIPKPSRYYIHLELK